MAEESELNVALIGTGIMGRMHSLAYATLPSFFPDLPPSAGRVVVDVTEDLARRGAHQFGYDEWAVGWEEVIGRPDIDIVDIVTPNDSHRPIAELAMKAGQARSLREAACAQRRRSPRHGRASPRRQRLSTWWASTIAVAPRCLRPRS